jgi:hypothetical protein
MVGFCERTKDLLQDAYSGDPSKYVLMLLLRYSNADSNKDDDDACFSWLYVVEYFQRTLIVLIRRTESSDLAAFSISTMNDRGWGTPLGLVEHYEDHFLGPFISSLSTIINSSHAKSWKKHEILELKFLRVLMVYGCADNVSALEYMYPIHKENCVISFIKVGLILNAFPYIILNVCITTNHD